MDPAAGIDFVNPDMLCMTLQLEFGPIPAVIEVETWST